MEETAAQHFHRVANPDAVLNSPVAQIGLGFAPLGIAKFPAELAAAKAAQAGIPTYPVEELSVDAAHKLLSLAKGQLGGGVPQDFWDKARQALLESAKAK